VPELPEVETIARDLRGLVEGAQIDSAEADWPATLRSHTASDFDRAVAGRRIEGVGRRGKQLLVWLAPQPGAEQGSPGAEPAVMTVHLKMTGQLFVVDPGTPRDRHVHAVFGLADGRQLRFRDIRKFGRIGLYRRDPRTGEPFAGEAVGVLAGGIEPLSDELTPQRFWELLSHRRGRLKSLLLNQDFVAGVGNIYADEALWRSRLHPLRDAHTLRRSDAARLHEALVAVLAEAIERRGSSVDDYTAPEGDGSMQEHLQVYQRAGEPCARCGRPIRRIVVGGRATHFCSWCQRLPREQLGDATGPMQAGERSAPGSPRRGPRWTELSGDGVLGRRRDEEAIVARRAEERIRRIEANRRAAAARRAAARAGGGQA
jgi:formamidopyrimidine-DNA glycosylase